MRKDEKSSKNKFKIKFSIDFSLSRSRRVVVVVLFDMKMSTSTSDLCTFYFSSLLFFIATKLKETWNFPNRDADDDATFFSEPRKFRSRNNRREEKKKLIQFQFNHLPSTRIRICARWALELNSMSFVIYYTFVIRDLSILSFFPPNQSDTEFSHPSFAFCGENCFLSCFLFHISLSIYIKSSSSSPSIDKSVKES